MEVTFQAAVSSGVPTAYFWSFGDGVWFNGSAASDSRPVHIYARAGTFDAQVTIWEGIQNASAEIPVAVAPGVLNAMIESSPTSGFAPLTVLFWANATGGSGTFVSFEWGFGDGGTGIGPETSDTFRTAGSYLVTVIVNDSLGHTTRASRTVVVHQSAGGGFLGLGVTDPFWVGMGLGLGAALLAWVGLVTYRRRNPPDPPTQWPLSSENSSSPRPDHDDDFSPPEPESFAGPTDAPVGRAGPASVVAIPEGTGGGAVRESVEPELSERRQISRLLILRMAALERLAPHDTPDDRWTQQGLGGALGIAQNRVSNVLRRLVASGVVEVETRHVLGRARRIKVYRLTARGESLAAAYRREKTRPPGSSSPTR